MDTRGLVKTIFLFTSLFCFNVKILGQDVKFFVSKATTKTKLDSNNEWKLDFRKEIYTPIVYGKNFIQIGPDSLGLRFRLYGKVEHSYIKDGEKFTRNGFMSDGNKMKTSTVFWKDKSMTISIELIGASFFYDIEKE